MPDSDNPRPALLSSGDIDFLENLGKTMDLNREFVPREESGVRTPCENGPFPIVGMALDTGFGLLDDSDTVSREEVVGQAVDIFGDPCDGGTCPQEKMDAYISEGHEPEDGFERCAYMQMSNLDCCSNCPIFSTCKGDKTH